MREPENVFSNKKSTNTYLKSDGFVLSGSKRLPGRKPTETGPRRVKTYAERLQEMKSDQKFSTPVAPRSQYGSSSKSPYDTCI